MVLCRREQHVWPEVFSLPGNRSRSQSLAVLAVLVLLLAEGAGISTATAAEPADSLSQPAGSEAAPQVDFARDIQPILARHCVDCHGETSTEPEAHLSLTGTRPLLAGGTGGPVVQPGSSSRSRLVQVLAKEARPHMPPEGQLTEAEILLLSRWIDQLDPATPVGEFEITEADRSHWSFQPLERPPVPEVAHRQAVRTPVDHFLLAQLEPAGLALSPPAAKSTQLRRLYFDLIGLPPTPEEVQAFENTTDPAAWERIVDELLASPHYGERWGRHWLDLARYADSSGFHDDYHRPGAWRYRDYVIRSFNADKPLGDFIREQLAGDELPDATRETWTATGFLRNGPTNAGNMGEGPAREKYRLDELDGIVSTVSTVMLGLTIGCARCHDHMYDPVSQRDYYQVLAVFDSTGNGRVPLTSFASGKLEVQPEQAKPGKEPYLMVRTDRNRALRETHVLWRGDVGSPGPAVEPGVPGILSGIAPFEQSRAASVSAEGTHGRRLQFADWISDSANPLTWRVMANRVWQHHLGRGLVETPGNFGLRGAAPTHPELLDWLAAELRDNGGRLKPLHRLLVTSAMYRQSSAATADGMRIDPENRLQWRAPRRRLEAEPLRDSILAMGGNLNATMGGPGIHPRIRPELLVASQRNKWPVVKEEGPEHWRRSVYVYVKRQLQLPMLELFDAPSTNHSCDNRRRSMVPTQSLVLMNDEFVRQQATAFARRVRLETGSTADIAPQVERALWTALGQVPESIRIQQGTTFVQSQASRLETEGMAEAEAREAALADFCHVLLNLSEFVYVD